jgi:hypothetical protein
VETGLECCRVRSAIGTCVHTEESIVRGGGVDSRFDSSMSRSHGQAGGGGTRTYHAWKSMVRCCTNPSSADWVRYGGRGITVCPRWHHFEDFLADMGPCPDNLTLDRINNEGNYEPGNCRWTTWQQQMLNRRSNRGERHPNAQLSVDDVWSIRRLARYGATYRSIASGFGVSHANVGYIVRREAWRKPGGHPGHREQAGHPGAADGPELEM